MRNRTLARRLALQFLYTLQMRGPEAMDDLEDFMLQESNKVEVHSFARRLIRGTFEHRDAIDKEIESVARNWQLGRMACVDINIIRMALFELLYTEDIPPIVSINEAIELAKAFGSDKSSSFVNGILDKFSQQAKDKKVKSSVLPGSENE